MPNKRIFQTALWVAVILLGARWVVNAIPGLRPLRGVL